MKRGLVILSVVMAQVDSVLDRTQDVAIELLIPLLLFFDTTKLSSILNSPCEDWNQFLVQRFTAEPCKVSEGPSIFRKKTASNFLLQEVFLFQALVSDVRFRWRVGQTAT